MGQHVVIRENIDDYMAGLKKHLAEHRDDRLEGMAEFFRARLDGYENVMSNWSEAYRHLAEIIPKGAKRILDLGCGTGLEIDEICASKPDLDITGIDMTKEMLAQLSGKHPRVRTICANYFEYDFGKAAYDLVISFETLHHFTPEKKQPLFNKIYNTLENGGAYIQVDYLACCDEEETLLMETCIRKRKAENIPDSVFVHFDTPLTAAHEMALMRNAGFESIELTGCIKGACFIVAKKVKHDHR